MDDSARAAENASTEVVTDTLCSVDGEQSCEEEEEEEVGGGNPFADLFSSGPESSESER